jgi:hypothetical protein
MNKSDLQPWRIHRNSTEYHKKTTKYRYFRFITHIITSNKAQVGTSGNDFLISSSFLNARRICGQFKGAKHISLARVFGACVTSRKIFAFTIKLYRPQWDNKHGGSVKFVFWDTSNPDYVTPSSPVYFFFLETDFNFLTPYNNQNIQFSQCDINEAYITPSRSYNSWPRITFCRLISW